MAFATSCMETVLEYSLLLNLSAASVATFYCRDPQFSGNQAVVVYISVGSALITFIGILIYHLYQCTITSWAWKMVSDWVTQRKNDREFVNIAAEGSDEEEEPPQAEIWPLMLWFNENREPVLVYDHEDCCAFGTCANYYHYYFFFLYPSFNDIVNNVH